MPWFVLYSPPPHPLPLPCPFPFSFYWFIWFVGLRPSNTIVWSMVPYYFLYCAVSFVNALELCFFFFASSFIYLYSEVVNLVPSIADTYTYIYIVLLPDLWPHPQGGDGGCVGKGNLCINYAQARIIHLLIEIRGCFIICINFRSLVAVVVTVVSVVGDLIECLGYVMPNWFLMRLRHLFYFITKKKFFHFWLFLFVAFLQEVPSIVPTYHIEICMCSLCCLWVQQFVAEVC